MKTADVTCGVIGAIFLGLALAVHGAHSQETGRVEQGLEADARRDHATAERILRTLSGGGEVQALHKLGLMYETGDGVPRDDAQALKWYRKAAEQGHAPAQFSLGLVYMTGSTTVPQDHAEMLKWWHKAARRGDADALLHLGLVHAWGEGVPRDDVTAYMWFSLAAGQGARMAVKPRNGIANRMTFDQRNQARERVRVWKATY